MTGSNGLTIGGTGTLNLATANGSVSGNDNLDSGNVIVGAATSLGSGTLLAFGGTLASSSFVTPITVTNVVNLKSGASYFTLTGASTFLMSGVFSLTGSLAVNMYTPGAGFSFSGQTNTYNGLTNDINGTLNLATAADSLPSATGAGELRSGRAPAHHRQRSDRHPGTRARQQQCPHQQHVHDHQ